jgi:hypothetical protein
VPIEGAVLFELVGTPLYQTRSATRWLCNCTITWNVNTEYWQNKHGEYYAFANLEDKYTFKFKERKKIAPLDIIYKHMLSSSYFTCHSFLMAMLLICSNCKHSTCRLFVYVQNEAKCNSIPSINRFPAKKTMTDDRKRVGWDSTIPK